MTILQEFKKFALKGNAIDLAVGVVIGAAFGGIVTSLVADIINPPLGLLTGSIDFSDKVIVLREATDAAEAVTLNYGAFITNLINFTITAFAIFLVVKQINILKDKEESKPPATEKTLSEEVKILTEIKDLLSRE